jgi:hypothetical protein
MICALLLIVWPLTVALSIIFSSQYNFLKIWYNKWYSGLFNVEDFFICEG